VDLTKTILVESKVEVWLMSVVTEMKEALRSKFAKFYDVNM